MRATKPDDLMAAFSSSRRQFMKLTLFGIFFADGVSFSQNLPSPSMSFDIIFEAYKAKVNSYNNDNEVIVSIIGEFFIRNNSKEVLLLPKIRQFVEIVNYGRSFEEVANYNDPTLCELIALPEIVFDERFEKDWSKVKKYFKIYPKQKTSFIKSQEVKLFLPKKDFLADFRKEFYAKFRIRDLVWSQMPEAFERKIMKMLEPEGKIITPNFFSEPAKLRIIGNAN